MLAEVSLLKIWHQLKTQFTHLFDRRHQQKFRSRIQSQALFVDAARTLSSAETAPAEIEVFPLVTCANRAADSARWGASNAVGGTAGTLLHAQCLAPVVFGWNDILLSFSWLKSFYECHATFMCVRTLLHLSCLVYNRWLLYQMHYIINLCVHMQVCLLIIFSKSCTSSNDSAATWRTMNQGHTAPQRLESCVATCGHGKACCPRSSKLLAYCDIASGPSPKRNTCSDITGRYFCHICK